MVEYLAIKNYKSLRDTQFKLKPLSVVVGPNSSGKSNLFDALMFLRDLVRVGQQAVVARGGFPTIVWSGNVDEKISFDLQGPLRSEQGVYSYRHFIELSGRPFRSFAVSKEFFGIFRNNEFRTLLEYPDKGQMASMYDMDGNNLGGFGGAEPASLLKDYSPYPGRNELLGIYTSHLKGWELYDPTPTLMRGAMRVQWESRLGPWGENLAGVLHTLHSEYPDIFETIQDRLRTLVPHSRRLLSLLTQEGQTYAGLEEDEIASKIPASSMSSGTLRFLAFLVALYSPDAPQLVCFEEPENNIHPHALELLIDVLKSGSRKRQVLVSTHSPYLLNFVDPDSVFVFERSQNETKVVEAGSRKNLKLLLRKVGLGEAWYAGTIGGVPAGTK
jgi:predicted ATPase